MNKKKLYKVDLSNGANHREYSLFVIADNAGIAEETAIDTMREWEYIYDTVLNIELLAEESRYGKPFSLVIAKE